MGAWIKKGYDLLIYVPPNANRVSWKPHNAGGLCHIPSSSVKMAILDGNKSQAYAI